MRPFLFCALVASLATAAASASESHGASIRARGLSSSAVSQDGPAPPVLSGVLTYRMDDAGTGLNPGETTLTWANVNTATFGKIMTWLVDGEVWAQPIVVNNVQIEGAFRSVVYVATMHGSVYAFAAANGRQYWRVSFVAALGKATWVNGVDYLCGHLTMPEIGVLSTPVVDAAAGTLYVLARTKESGQTIDRLHALDLRTGADKLSEPVVIAGSVAGTGYGSVGGVVTFDPAIQFQRASLRLLGNRVYIAYATQGPFAACNEMQSHGWLFAYDATTLQRAWVVSTTPNGAGAGVWNPGVLASDGSGNVYLASGNGDFDADLAGANYGMSVVKVSPSGAVLDWFTPGNWEALSAADKDMGSSGTLLVPGTNLVVVGSKGSGAADNELGAGVVYVLDRTSLGGIDATNAQIVQSWSNGRPVFTPFGWLDGAMYFGDSAQLNKHALSGGLFGTSPAATAAGRFNRGSPWISANGTSNGVVWIADNGSIATSPAPAVLYAFKASDLTTLWSSDQVGGDVARNFTKWATPVAYRGRVYLGGAGGVTVYGLK